MSMSRTSSIRRPKALRQSQIFIYVLPVMGTTFLIGPLAILQGIYAKYFGLSLSTIATVLLISRLFDAISDPTIGYLSDWYHDRYYSRKPFVIIGGFLFVTSSYFLYAPPTSVSPVYFLVCFLAFYLSFTMFEIPHLSWGGELGGTSEEKTRVFAWRAVSVNVGAMMFFAVPLLPVFESSEFTPQTLRWSSVIAGCCLIPMLYFCVKNVPISTAPQVQDRCAGSRKISMKALPRLWQSVTNNHPLLLFLAAYSCIGLGVGMWGTLIFLFVDRFLGLGQHFALVYVISYGVSTLSLVGWSKLANRRGKKQCWLVASLLIIIGLLSTTFLLPGQGSYIPLLLCMVITYSGFAALSLLAPSLLSEIADFGAWKFGTDRAGTYFSLFSLVSKTNVAFAGALALGLASFYGFDATSEHQSSEAVAGLHLAMAWLPVPIILLSIVLVTAIPIDSRRHAIIRRHINNKKQRMDHSEIDNPSVPYV